MNVELLLQTYREPAIGLLAAAAVTCGILVTLWPYLVSDTLARRMRLVTDEAERIRVRERARLKAGDKVSLRREPRKLFKDIVERFGLAQEATDGEMRARLRMAGFRGEGPIMAFLAMRFLLPLGLFAFAAFYVFVLIDLAQPFALKWGICVVAACAGYYGPAIYVKNRIDKRQQAMRRAWPDALDLLLICVESGMSIEGALRKVAIEIGAQSVELAEELSLTTAEMSYLADRRKAFENLSDRTGVDSIRQAVTTLVQAEKHGTSLGQSLRVLAQESRDLRMSLAEKKAAALPPKLTVPMIVFFLPVLFGVILGPAGIQIMNL
ncbi:tight adherence protein C [Palleronia aestuarii]|uniref:Tight adherence protein C n=1 Tax=Palleronia aestuarii TaxID=568105 RepID=A0A2W7NPA7_9RHOB|nr:type II secretion system F family protein [Palleronia aestuarii]PZX13112.1 tight adherence protein C [Palleronia aestuarii]